MDQPDVEVRLGAVGVGHFGGEVFADTPLDRLALVLGQRFLRHGGQRPRRLDPHQPHRVGEQRQQVVDLQLRRQRLQRPRRRTPHQRVGVGQQGAEGLEPGGIEPFAQQGRPAGASDMGLVRIFQQGPQ